ncbi:MAG: hypothetical protein Greene101449_207 [Candidatus Peregrinibacteria bacterium Greene1014_49]|nr:MAG: hypothetical protein Greene101449_207 [Candidatus Peregrinibacteria bacterium Greene1014_49]
MTREPPRRGAIPLSVISALEEQTHSVVYALSPEKLGDRFPVTLPWREHGKNPFCHTAALGELDPVTKLVIEPGCGYSCCHVAPGAPNTIAAGPSEISTTEKNVTHLQLLGEEGAYFGGSRYHCTTGECNPAIDAKPNDCKWYPFFLVITDDNHLKILVGQKCPMPDIAKKMHLLQTLKHAGEIITAKPEWISFLRRAHQAMVGYVNYDYSFFDALNEQDFEAAIDEKIIINSIREAVRVMSNPETADLSVTDKQALVEKYAQDMKIMRTQAMAIFRQLKRIDINYTKGISIADLKALGMQNA